MNQEGYFHNPVYTDPVVDLLKTKQIGSQRSQIKEARVAKHEHEDPQVHEQLIALRHELRRRIMQILGRSPNHPISPREVSGELQQPLSNVRYHVRVLAECKAINLVETKPVRGSMQHFY